MILKRLLSGSGRFIVCSALPPCCCCPLSPWAHAQHVMTINSNSNVVTETAPAEDEVLADAPDDLMMRFSITCDWSN